MRRSADRTATQKPRIVFILGAGASADAGAPLMATFLDRAEVIRDRVEGDDRHQFDLAFRGVAELAGAQSKASIDRNNIESVYAAFEIAALLGRLGSMSEKDVGRLPQALDTLIARTIELSFAYQVLRFERPERISAGPYDALVRQIVSAVDNGTLDVSVITFNYDTGIDVALDAASVPFAYWLGPGGDRIPTAEGIPREPVDLLKLHGSLNWVRRPTARTIHCLSTRHEAIMEHMGATVAAEAAPTVFVKWADLAMHACGPDASGPIEQVIVPPTWSKASRHAMITPVWRRAAKVLAEAWYIFVIGYSLPPGDAFFRYLFALATMGPTRTKQIVVVDLHPNGERDRRYADLLGPATRSRLAVFDRGFGDFVNEGSCGSLPKRLAEIYDSLR